MGKLFEKIYDHPIISIILFGCFLGGLSDIIQACNTKTVNLCYSTDESKTNESEIKG